MKDTLTVGLTHRIRYQVPAHKTVPHVFEDSADFAAMPEVLATAFLVGLLERACVEALRPHLDGPHELTVGTHIDVSHTAATPPGLTVTVDIHLVEIDRKRLVFDVTAHDGVDEITRGRHERFIVGSGAFTTRAAAKAAAANDAAG